MDWLDLLAVQKTLKSLLQHHSSKASIFQCSAFFIVQVLPQYMTTGKTIVLTRQTFVDKVMSLLFNMLSRLVKQTERIWKHPVSLKTWLRGLPWWSSSGDSAFPLQGAQIWSEVGELKSCMLQGIVKKNLTQSQCWTLSWKIYGYWKKRIHLTGREKPWHWISSI